MLAQAFLQLAELAFGLRQTGLGGALFLFGLGQLFLPMVDFGLLLLKIGVELAQFCLVLLQAGLGGFQFGGGGGQFGLRPLLLLLQFGQFLFGVG